MNDTFGEKVNEATNKNNHIFIGNGYEVEFKVESQWETAFNGVISIRNTGTATIESWALEFYMNNKITNIWDGVIQSSEEGKHIIKHNSTNQDIPVGGSVSFGFSASGNEIDYPENYIIPVYNQNTDEYRYTAVFTLHNDWVEGFSGSITVTNNSDKVIENWILEFDFDKHINNIWNAVIENSDNGHYVIKHASYNQNIAPGQSITIGFSGIDGNVQNGPINYQLRETIIGEDTEYVTVRTNDAMIGLAYFQELKPEDICIEEDGIQYAKNQMNLVGKEHSNFAQFEELGRMLGFEIVGYIEFTKDYQIKFFQDKTYQQMNEYAENLLSYNFIEEAHLNLVTEIGEDYYPKTDIEWPKNEWTKEPAGINWGVEAINAPEAWNYRDEMHSIKIGLIDTMFDKYHEDLSYTKIWNNSPYWDALGKKDHHGTHVAGTMAAGFDNGIGISGIAVKKELYAYSFNGEKSDPIASKMSTNVMEYKYAFALLIGNGIRVINVSLANSGMQCFGASRGNVAAIKYIKSKANILGSFLKRLVDRGFDYVIVTSAGNYNKKKYVADRNEIYGYRLAEEGEEGQIGGILAEYNSFLNYITELRNRIIVVGAYELENSDKIKIIEYSNIGERVDILAPGQNIYSAFLGNKYGYKSGTSMAAPHVAGTAALIYSSNPLLKDPHVKNIILSTANEVGLKDSSGKYAYDTVNAGEAVKKSIATKGINYGSAEQTGIILGIVKNIEENEPQLVEGVLISAYKYSTSDGITKEYGNITTTNENGEFDLELAPGTYHIEFYKSGYLPLVMYHVEVVENEVIYLEKLIVREKSYEINGKDYAYGMVRDAITGKSVPNVTIRFRKGWNNKIGNYVGETITTNAFGSYSALLDRGYYTAELYKEGYITGYMNIVTVTSRFTKNQDAVISPILSDNEYRIVLTWGSIPSDLDAHLYGNTDEYSFHVYYTAKTFEHKGKVIASLDVDDTTSYGPETITTIVDVNKKGLYRYSVHDFSNRTSTNSTALSVSGASVKVFKVNEHLITYYAPTNKVGNLWRVFEIEDGKIKRLGTLSNESSPGNIR